MDSSWEAKYVGLKGQCIDIEKNNMKLMNRIYQVKRMIKRAHRERKAIMDRLDFHNDNFRCFDLYFDADVLKESSTIKPAKIQRIDRDRFDMHSSMNAADSEYTSHSHGISYLLENAYRMFCKQARKEILNAKPEIGQIELTKILEEKWAKLMPKDKEEYCRMYEESKRGSGTLQKEIVSNFKDDFDEERQSSSARRGLALSPNLTSFADNNDLPSNISLPEIPSPTLNDVDHPFGISTIPSPSFR